MSHLKIVSGGNRSRRGAVRPPALRVTEIRPRSVRQGGGRPARNTLPDWGDPPRRTRIDWAKVAFLVGYAALWVLAVHWMLGRIT